MPRLPVRNIGISIILAALSLNCKPRIEYVPIPCPPPPVLVRPVLPIKEWQPGKWTQAELEKILWQSLAMEVGYSKALEEALAAYRKPPSNGQKLP